ncbi:MAG TPA: superoxide dismutase family protein, partial [Thermoanaerobaculia bacterium]|nr:superoxide dismutase family protein [Thermoanaerobaculia bacterium]
MKMKKSTRATWLAAAGAGALLLGSAPMAAEGPAKSAQADLAGADGSGIRGKVTFTEMGDHVMIVAEVEGAPPGAHGFHVHEKGDCSAADFTSAGGHFNPTG